MKPLAFAHVSDLHLPFEPCLSGMQRLSKRQLSAWAWRRRGAVQRPEILDALVTDLQSRQLDHIVITGDITNFSLPGEFRQAASWLAALAPAQHISLVPGNHDALVAIDARAGLDCWSAWTRAQGGWPFVHHRDGVALIGLNSARPSAPLLARGALGETQLSRLAQILESEREAGRLRVLLLHHPVAEGAVSRRKALADRAQLRALLQRHGAELVLHGHARDARLDALPGPHAPIPCLGVPSSSALPNPHDEGARWHHLQLWRDDRNRARAKVQVRRWSIDAHAFVDTIAYTLWLP